MPVSRTSPRLINLRYSIVRLGCAMLLASGGMALAQEKSSGDSPIPAAEKRWRKEVDVMTDQQKEDFYQRRQEIKSDIMQMDNDEREDFYRQLKTDRERGETMRYIEAAPRAVEHDAPLTSDKVDDWDALSYEQKSRLLREPAE